MAVSVVIPVYNAADTIGEQLDALERQDLSEEWEIVIALQPCTDGTDMVVAAHRSERVRVVEAFERRGPSYARNAGVGAARAPLIAFCDADDIVADDWLVELLRHRSAPVVAGGEVQFEAPYDRRSVDWSKATVPGVDCLFMQAAYTNNMLVHRSAFLAVGGFDLDLDCGEDNDLSWRLQLAGHELAVAPTALVLYRQRPTVWSRWHQHYRWYRNHPALYRRFRSHGMPRSDTRKALKEWLWLVVRLPLVIVRPPLRSLWHWRSAERVGHLVGSVRHRTFYP